VSSSAICVGATADTVSGPAGTGPLPAAERKLVAPKLCTTGVRFRLRSAAFLRCDELGLTRR